MRNDCLSENDLDDDIDWDEIFETTQPDFLAGRFAFNSADYPSHEEAMVAMRKLVHELCEEGEREAARLRSLDASR
jgi:hypothetical protein